MSVEPKKVELHVSTRRGFGQRGATGAGVAHVQQSGEWRILDALGRRPRIMPTPANACGWRRTLRRRSGITRASTALMRSATPSEWAHASRCLRATCRSIRQLHIRHRTCISCFQSTTRRRSACIDSGESRIPDRRQRVVFLQHRPALSFGSREGTRFAVRDIQPHRHRPASATYGPRHLRGRRADRAPVGLEYAFHRPATTSLR